MRTTLKGFGIVTLFMFAWQGRADITVGSQEVFGRGLDEKKFANA